MSSRAALLRAFALLLAVTAAFTIYTIEVVLAQGYTGFIELALADAWGGQMFVDLVIALVLFATWMTEDARREGIPSWPYLVLICATGSIGALAYLIHRTGYRLRAASTATGRAGAA
jgi:protein-S-isoprenylcysteine O-methyltransferase Ste14